MVFDKSGRKKGHKFVRGLMRSAAKLSYEQAQAAIDGQPDDKTGPLLEPILQPLWEAYRTMKIGRDARSPLAIESDERRIIIREGEILSITKRPSLEAHKLIEEMMVQANVCAAESLEAKRSPLIYRVHDTPSLEKVQNLADFLQTLEIRWDKGQAPQTARFNKLLDETREGPNAAIINEVVLRTQMQAHYSADNIGHFGLNLAKYAHFTSPIRRYADLIVHRGLIRALGLGDDGLTDQDIAQIKDTAEVITHAERRAMAAERDATDRYIAAFLADRVARHLRRPGHRRHALWPVREAGRHRGRRLGAGLDPGRGVLRPRREAARPGWRPQRPALDAGHERRGKACRGHAGHRRAPVRDAQRPAAGGSEDAAAQIRGQAPGGREAARRVAERRAARQAALGVGARRKSSP